METSAENHDYAIDIIEGLSTEDFGKVALDLIGEEYLMDLIRNAVGEYTYSGKFNNLSKEETLRSLGISADMLSRMETLDGK
jgi:hypothetical protein